jgi:hypothetical protein
MMNEGMQVKEFSREEIRQIAEETLRALGVETKEMSEGESEVVRKAVEEWRKGKKKGNMFQLFLLQKEYIHLHHIHLYILNLIRSLNLKQNFFFLIYFQLCLLFLGYHQIVYILYFFFGVLVRLNLLIHIFLLGRLCFVN